MVVAAVATTSRPTATTLAVVASTSRLAMATALSMAAAAIASSSLTTPTTLAFVASAAIYTSRLTTGGARAFGTFVGASGTGGGVWHFLDFASTGERSGSVRHTDL
jgi:hypothetical protein